VRSGAMPDGVAEIAFGVATPTSSPLHPASPPKSEAAAKPAPLFSNMRRDDRSHLVIRRSIGIEIVVVTGHSSLQRWVD
jgi:hypothetical protein